MSKDLLPYLPIVIVAFIVMRRTGKPREVKLSMLWITPAILGALTLFYAWGAYRIGPHLSIYDDLIIAACAAGGVALGFVRAHTVKLDRHPETGKIHSTLTLWGVGFIVLWVGGRALLRSMGYVGVSVPFGVFTDGTMALAVASVCTHSLVMARRCRELGITDATPAETT